MLHPARLARRCRYGAVPLFGAPVLSLESADRPPPGRSIPWLRLIAEQEGDLPQEHGIGDLGRKPLRGGSSDRPLVCASAEVVVEHRTAKCPLPKEMTLLSRLRLPAVYQDRPD